MRGMPEGLPPDREAFVRAIRDLRGRRIPLRVFSEKCERGPGAIQRYFVGATLPDIETARIITEVCGGDWGVIEALWRAARGERSKGTKSNLTKRVDVMGGELLAVKQCVTELEMLVKKLTADKGGPTVSTTKKYILIRRTPKGEIKAHTTAFDGFIRAARVAGQTLFDNGVIVTQTAAIKFAESLRQQPIGVIWGHPSGYDFRILRADFTTDNVAITPGLRVITNDVKWGIVEPTQFMCETDDFGPGGVHHDGWYNLTDKEGRPYNKFNGERLATRSPF